MNTTEQPDSDDLAFGEIKFFSPGSRINRLRYWAHSMLIAIPFYIVFAIGAYLATKVSPVFWGLPVVAYIGLIAFSFVLVIQRLHDVDKSGWMSLLMLVPFANIYLFIVVIFFEGTKGRNQYGLQTPPNKTWHWVMALIMPVVFFIGIMAAIAIPTYYQYKLRAAEAQQQQLQQALPEAPAAVEGESSEAAEGAVESEAVEADSAESATETSEASSTETVTEPK